MQVFELLFGKSEISPQKVQYVKRNGDQSRSLSLCSTSRSDQIESVASDLISVIYVSKSARWTPNWRRAIKVNLARSSNRATRNFVPILSTSALIERAHQNELKPMACIRPLRLQIIIWFALINICFVINFGN